jgi:deoxyribonuclease-4
MKIGLKLYSTDTPLISEAKKIEENYFDFIELFVVPGSFEGTIEAWKDFIVPFTIHAPHSFHGVNLARADHWETNDRLFHEARRFADSLLSEIIIAHSGHSGFFEETIRQLRLINDKRICLENKPKKGLFDEECVGWAPSDFRIAFESGVVSRVVLDFVHANCAARSVQMDAVSMIKDFLTFNPKFFHLSDGDHLSEKDTHLNFGKGTLDIVSFLSVVPSDGWLTIEAPRNPVTGLNDFLNDVHFLRKVALVITEEQEVWRSREEGFIRG